MKVLLVYTNRNRFMAPPPIGLATLCPPLRAAGHQVRLLDLMFAGNPEKSLQTELDNFSPDAVGYCIRNVDEQDMSRPSTTLDDIRPFVAAATSRHLPTILGGSAFSTFPEQMLDFMGADYGIVGQGEQTLPKLLECMGNGGDKSLDTRLPGLVGDKSLDTRLPGLVWREGSEIRVNPSPPISYVGVRPDWTKIDHRRYRRSMLQSAVVVRSGCDYRCGYCDVPPLFGDRFIRRDTESIIDDIRRLRNEHGVRVVFLNDPAFNAPLDEAKALLSTLAREKLGVYLGTTFVPVSGHYDDEYFTLFRQAGGLLSVFGVEALSGAMIRSYAKPFTLDDVHRSCEMATRNGVRSICMAMFGGPGETDATIDEAASTISQLPYTIMSSVFGIRVMPRTPLADVALSTGLIKQPSDLFRPTFFLSRDMDVQRARRKIRSVLRRRAARSMRMLPVGTRIMLARFFGVVF